MQCSLTTLNCARQLHRTDYDSLVISFQKCTAGVKAWMLENKLKLNDRKTEAIRSSPSLGLAHALASSISLGACDIQITQKVRDLGFLLD